ncbi:response regulator transcription factor [Microbacterium sp. KRD172]|uniref:response regulator transcription factor n=1 Tax=Microbacterium sp. KRD172 TaxID=2729727 RepID=UPI0019D15FBB|nr:response regulator transcription factor [Microbacterium sp. KRD172]
MHDAAHPQKTAVIVEDDPDVRHLLAEVLEAAGFSTVSADNGIDGVNAVLTHQPLITTLDVNMPGIDGFEAARRIRAQSDTYIIMLTALDEEADVVLGLTAGADEYLDKPFRPRELRARIEALLRRPRSSVYSPREEPAAQVDADDETWIAHRDLRLDPDSRIALVQEREIELTRTEFDLLNALMQSKRRVRSKVDLTLLLRGEAYVTSSFVSDADKRAVEAHMTNLRRKLGDDPTQPRYIETVRGVGYRLTRDVAA